MPTKKWYLANKEKYDNYVIQRRKEQKEYLLNLLGNKCIKCNSTSDLEFDHIDPKIKSFDIGACFHHDLSKLIEEVKKCQLLCYSCHRIKSGQVEHGGGVSGKGGCKCNLCRNKKLEYDRNRYWNKS